MKYTYNDIYDFIEENDIKFIKLAFCDILGNLKNISILASQMKKAIDHGISIDASAIKGFGGEEKSDLFIYPDLDTMALLPFRNSQGGVIRFYCNIKYPDGKYFELDSRRILINAMKILQQKGLNCNIGSECEFYLFKKDEYGNPTNIPYDNASYLDMEPDDKGEDVRREICLALEKLNIIPEACHHEEGPGQNEIDFRYSNPLNAADNILTVKTVVKTISEQYGVYASFDPKPIIDKPGNGLHINISTFLNENKNCLLSFMAGIMNRIKDITLFLNTTEQSYRRLGEFKAPKYITWSKENRSQLIRIPAAKTEYERIELRSPDPLLNPYLAYALIIYSGIEGIDNKLIPSKPVDVNLFSASSEFCSKLDTLPMSFNEAYEIALKSEFINRIIPKRFIKALKDFL